VGSSSGLRRTTKVIFCISSRSILLHRGFSHSQLYWTGAAFAVFQRTQQWDKSAFIIIISHKSDGVLALSQKVAATTTKVIDLFVFGICEKDKHGAWFSALDLNPLRK